MSTENNTSPQVWRVVVACNEVQPHTHTREVNVCRNHLGWFTSETTSLGLATSHAAVMEHVHEKRWPVVEIVAPGQPTRAELEAEVARLKQEVTYADRAMHERHGMFSDLCADVTLLARDRWWRCLVERDPKRLRDLFPLTSKQQASVTRALTMSSEIAQELDRRERAEMAEAHEASLCLWCIEGFTVAGVLCCQCGGTGRRRNPCSVPAHSHTTTTARTAR